MSRAKWKEFGTLAGVLEASIAQTINGAAVILIVFLIALYSRTRSISFNKSEEKTIPSCNNPR